MREKRTHDAMGEVGRGADAAAAPTRPCSSRLVRVLRALGWLLWAAALQGAVAPLAYDGSMSTSPRYTAIAFGMLIVAFSFTEAGHGIGRLYRSRTACICMAATGCCATAAGITLSYPGVQGVLSGLIVGFAPFNSLGDALEMLLFAVSAACCTASGLTLAMCELGRGERQPRARGLSERRATWRDTAVLLAMGATGLLRAPAMLWCLPHARIDVAFSGGAMHMTVLGESAGAPVAAFCLSLLIATAAAVVCAAHARSRAGDLPRADIASWTARIAAAYGTGGIMWYLLMQVMSLRVAITDAASLACFAVELGMLCTVMVLVRADVVADSSPAMDHAAAVGADAAVSPAPAGRAGADEAGSSDSLAQPSLGLTDRERECLRLALAGSTSAAIAEELGIGASTARSYLQRAYRKLGVSSLGEAHEFLAARAASEQVIDVSLNERPCPADSEPHAGARAIGWDAKLLAGAFAMLMALLLLPDASRASWGSGFASVYAIVAAALVIAVQQLGPSGGLPGSRTGRAGARAVPVATVLAVFVALLGIARAALLTVGYRSLSLPFDGWFGIEHAAELLVFCALLCALFALARRVLAVLPRTEWVPRPCLPGFAVGSLLGVAAVVLVPAGPLAPVLSAVLSVGCAALSVRVLRHGPYEMPAVDEADEFRVPFELDQDALPALVPTVLLAACALEAVWRDRAQFSFVWALAPWLILIAVLLLWFLFAHVGIRFTVGVLACGIVGIALACLAGCGSMAMFAFDAVLLCCLFCYVRGRVTIARRLRACCLATMAVGLVASLKAVNVFGDVSLWAHQSIYSSFSSSVATIVPVSGVGDLRGTLLALGAVFVAVMTIGSLVLFAALVRTTEGEISVRRQLAVPTFDDGRLRSYLAGRGLNETQAEIIIATARGKTAAAIAAELHYAPGTVSSARDTGYRLLRVHSRAQLVTLLRRDAGL